MLVSQQDENSNPVPSALQVSDEEFTQWQQQIGNIKLPDAVFELIFQLRQQLDALPNAPYVSDRRWKKAIRLLQASAFFSGRDSIAPIDLILLKDCLWHNVESMHLMSQQLETLMTCHAWQQQAMLTRLGAIVQRRIQIQQQQSDKTALKVTRLGGMFSRKPHYELPAEIQGSTLTLLLQQPLKLHDMEVIHITFEREALANWLEKGGEIRGKLNGIGFAQLLNMDVDTSQHLVVRAAQRRRICRRKFASSWKRWMMSGTSNITASASSKSACLSRSNGWEESKPACRTSARRLNRRSSHDARYAECHAGSQRRGNDRGDAAGAAGLSAAGGFL